MTEPSSRIEAALARLGAEHEPPAGWEAKVLAQIEHVSWWRRLMRWKIAIPIAATAAAAIVILKLIPHEPVDRPLGLALAYKAPDGVYRGGGSRQVGEVMRAVATDGHRYRALWVYRDDKLVVACPGGPGCSGSEDDMVVELELKLAGDYNVVALTSSSPISPPSGGFDGDVAGAQRAGATVNIKPVKVH